MKIAIVTGASSGMGREFARQIADGQSVDEIWVLARRKERLEELAAQGKTRMLPLECDLANDADLVALEELLADSQPDVRMLVNAAGFAKFGGFGEVRHEDELAMIDLNIRALVRITQMTIPFMQSGAHIVQVASTAAFQPLPEMNVYAATKAFVYSYTRSLNTELQTRGISCTAVCPGFTKTEFFDVAERNANPDAVHTSPFMAEAAGVVRRALKDAYRERELSVYGFFNKVHLFFSKILPDSFIMTMWRLMK